MRRPRPSLRNLDGNGNQVVSSPLAVHCDMEVFLLIIIDPDLVSVLVNVNANVNGRIVVLPARVSIQNGVNNGGLQQMRTLAKIRIMIHLNSIRQQQGSKQSFDIDVDVNGITPPMVLLIYNIY